MTNKKGLNRYLWIVFFFCIFFGLTTETAFAKEVMSFTYENVLPKNQEGDADFFKLKVKPGDSQTLETRVTNKTSKPLIVEIKISDATTSSSGIISYSPSKEKLANKKGLKITEMLDAPNQIKLKAYETKKIEYKLKVPKKEFDGIVLGGIQLKELKDNAHVPNVKKDEGAIKNEFSYVYSISLRENNKKIAPDMTSSGNEYDKIAYTVINNMTQSIVSNVKVETLLMKDDDDKIIDDFTVDNYRMAPNSAVRVPMEGTDELDIGKYRTETKVTVAKKVWKFKGKFEVTKEDKEFSDTLIDDTSKGKAISWFIFVLVIVSFIATGLGIFYLLNKRNKQKLPKNK